MKINKNFYYENYGNFKKLEKILKFEKLEKINSKTSQSLKLSQNLNYPDNFVNKYVYLVYSDKVVETEPLSSNNLFKLFLKSLNKNYPIPPALEKFLPNTFKLINQLSYTNYNIDYYSPIYGIISNRIVGNFDYLFKSGIIFFLLANSKGKNLKEELLKLMNENKDPLEQEITFFLNNQTYLNKKIFDYLSNLFISNSPYYISNIPSNILQLLAQVNIIYTILNQKNYIDMYLRGQIKEFLSKFSTSFNINLINYANELDFKEVEVWKQLFGYLNQFLITIDNIKSYPISNKQELDKFLESLYFLNLSFKDVSQLLITQSKLISKEHSEILKQMINTYQSYGLNYKEASKNSLMLFYFSYLSYVNSFIKKVLKNKDFNYGDFNHFLQIYVYSSFLIELIKASKDNTSLFNDYKSKLTNLLLSKNFANNFVSFLASDDKQKVLSALEVLKNISQKAIGYSFSVDPKLQKDRSLYLRLNLWLKTLKNIPQDSKYQENLYYMFNHLKSILSDYPNTESIKSIIQKMDYSYIMYWLNILEPIFNLLSSSSIAKKYDNSDYLFSQCVMYVFWKNKSTTTYYDDNIKNIFFENLYSNDKDLTSLIEDMKIYGFLNIENKNFLFDVFIEVLGNYYLASTFLL